MDQKANVATSITREYTMYVNEYVNQKETNITNAYTSLINKYTMHLQSSTQTYTINTKNEYVIAGFGTFGLIGTCNLQASKGNLYEFKYDLLLDTTEFLFSDMICAIGIQVGTSNAYERKYIFPNLANHGLYTRVMITGTIFFKSGVGTNNTSLIINFSTPGYNSTDYEGTYVETLNGIDTSQNTNFKMICKGRQNEPSNYKIRTLACGYIKRIF